jgi:hypothetical protein
MALALAFAPAGAFADNQGVNEPFRMPSPRDRFEGKIRPVLVRDARGDLEFSAARIWNEVMLNGIRRDNARPTVHARNLFHMSAAMWDAWVAYDTTGNVDPFLSTEKARIPAEATAADIEAMRAQTISFAAYQIIKARFSATPGAATTLPELDATMDFLGYNKANHATVGKTPAALGNRIAIRYLCLGLNERANEEDNYVRNNGYEPVNPPFSSLFPGNPTIIDPNRWQPMEIEGFVDQTTGMVIGPYPAFVCPHWGYVTPFGFTQQDRDPITTLYVDPGPPPFIGGVGDQEYKDGFLEVGEFSGWLDPDDGVTIDISPAVFGNNPLGTNDGVGHGPNNPVTGLPYAPNVVKRGDYTRILAEFWADGPSSETPPGHWNTVANYVSDHPDVEKRIGGQGEIVSDLEWDVKLYLALNGGLHDTAIAVWHTKWYYDYIRPISAIRYMAGLGQSSDPNGPSYHPSGIPLQEGVSAVITEETIAPGGIHEHLVERVDGILIDDHVGDIALYSWNRYTENPATEYTGAGWNLAALWVPYQRPTFVTPPFAGYTSGHSAFSRCGAEVLAAITGSIYFPAGMGVFDAPQNAYLVFEDGPSEDIELQWAAYYDASDESGISRRYGGIHPRQDDYPSRITGQQIGFNTWERAQTYFNGTSEVRGDSSSWTFR